MKESAKAFLSGSLTINLRDELEAIRKRSVHARESPDLLWRKLCSVVATSGSSVNADAFMRHYETALRFDLLPKTKVAREKAIYALLVSAKVPRMRKKKAHDLSENYLKVLALGGPELATKKMLNLSGKQEKKVWIRQFDGVGEKYSNDIWMGINDPDFQDSIALDARVKSFAKLLGFDTKSQTLGSNLLQFANACGLSGWELDRLIYNFGGVILELAKRHGALKKTS
jgi:hypothetical protein